jgi:hypothetical protein
MIRREVIKAGDKSIEVSKVGISDAGRLALEVVTARRLSRRLPDAR